MMQKYHAVMLILFAIELILRESPDFLSMANACGGYGGGGFANGGGSSSSGGLGDLLGGLGLPLLFALLGYLLRAALGRRRAILRDQGLAFDEHNSTAINELWDERKNAIFESLCVDQVTDCRSWRPDSKIDQLGPVADKVYEKYGWWKWRYPNGELGKLKKSFKKRVAEESDGGVSQVRVWMKENPILSAGCENEGKTAILDKYIAEYPKIADLDLTPNTDYVNKTITFFDPCISKSEAGYLDKLYRDSGKYKYSEAWDEIKNLRAVWEERETALVNELTQQLADGGTTKKALTKWMNNNPLVSMDCINQGKKLVADIVPPEMTDEGYELDSDTYSRSQHKWSRSEKRRK